MQQPRNLAARAGRWSATHRKTAVIGWILFVVLATVVGGKVGQQNLESSKMGNGESKRHDIIVDNADFPDEVGERVLIQGKGDIKADSPEVTAAVKDVVNRLGQIEGVSDIESPLNRQAAREHGLRGRALRARDVHAARQVRHQGGAGGAGDGRRRSARGRRRRPGGPPGAARRGARRRVGAQGARRHRARRRGQVQPDLDGRHADHPAARVRRGRRRRRPAAARHLRVRGDHGPARPGQPARAAARGRPDRDDADRPGRRRRLRDVLPAPDDGGAGQGPLVRERARRRRRHLGSRGADLRLHRHRRDGRDVLLRQRDLLVVRHRHDPRRRRRHDRLAHVPAGRALLPRPEGLAGEGPPALHRQAPPQEQGRVARCGTRS